MDLILCLMKPSLKEKGIESIDAYMDRIVSRFPHSAEYVTQIDFESSRKVVKRFPAFIAVCLVLWVAMVMYRDEYSFGSFITYLCLSFVVCFAILGAIRFNKLGPGPLPKWMFYIWGFTLSFFMVAVGNVLGSIDFPALIDSMLTWIGIGLDEILLLLISVLALSFIMIFTPAGVLYVITAYLTYDMPKLFGKVYRDSLTGERSKAEAFFQIPDFVDVKDVIMEPDVDYDHFNSEVLVNLFTYIVIMGVLFSSYLFINPLFLDTMSPRMMLGIMVMLAMFVPAIVIPWQIIRDLKAQAITDAARPYYLWNGAKRHLFSSFLTLGAFMMMFVLAMYYGHSVEDIFVNYLNLLIPLVCIAGLTAFMYTNSVNNSLKVMIYSRFMDRKKKIEEQVANKDNE